MVVKSYSTSDTGIGSRYFPPTIYFTIDNWWYDAKIRLGRIPTFIELQEMCARRGIAGTGLTYPDSSMRAIYGRLCQSPDPIIRECLGESGHCAPLHYYRDVRVFYMSAEADRAMKRKIDKILAERKRRREGGR